MAQVANSHIIQLGPRPNALPRMLKVGEVRTGLPTGYHQRIFVIARKGLQEPDGRRCQRHRPAASLAVCKPEKTL